MAATRNGSVWALVDPWNTTELGFVVSGSATDFDPLAFLPAYNPELRKRSLALTHARRLAKKGVGFTFNRPDDVVWGMGVGDGEMRAQMPILKDALDELLAGFRAVRVNARGKHEGEPISLCRLGQAAKPEGAAKRPMVKATAKGRRVGVPAHS